MDDEVRENLIVNSVEWAAMVSKKSDLIIGDIWVDWSENCAICYTVINTGNKTAPPHSVALRVDGVEVAVDFISTTLPAGGNYSNCFDFVWTYTPPEDSVTVCADSGNVVAEESE